MRRAANYIKNRLLRSSIHTPRCPVYCDVDGTPYRSKEDLLFRFSNQVWTPINWEVTTNHLYTAYAPQTYREGLLGRNDENNERNFVDNKPNKTRVDFPIPKSFEVGAGKNLLSLLKTNFPAAIQYYTHVNWRNNSFVHLANCKQPSLSFFIAKEET